PSCPPQIHPPLPKEVVPSEPVPLPKEEESDDRALKSSPEEELRQLKSREESELRQLKSQVEQLMWNLESRIEKSVSMLETRFEPPRQSVQELFSRQDATLPKPTNMPCAPPEESLPPPHNIPRALPRTVNNRWSGVIRDAILDGEWQAAGAVACPIIVGNGAPHYEQHDWKILQQAKKTIMENGIKSEASRTMLDWIFTADTNSPHDCKNLARLLLTPSQYIIFTREWRQLAELEAARPREAQDHLNGITADMITGAGAFSNMTSQLQYPLALFHLSAQQARQAFYAVPDANPVPSFTSVKQGLTEDYTHFVDRLSNALASQADMTEESKQNMFKLLAFDNANAKTKAVLATLPKNADVGDMIEMA
ncbi:GAK9 protein, partial [Atlantisia rogersi]|nr:GAK9 protein [Atlantisia rogersi]